MSARYIELDTLVHALIDERGGTTHDYRRLYQIGVRGIRELHFDVSGVAKTEVLTLKDNFTACLPDDYVSYTKIGKLTSDGKVETFGVNKDLALVNSKEDDRQIPSGSPYSITGAYVYTNDYNNYYADGRVYNVFGVGGDVVNRGYYRIDEHEGLITFDSEVSGTIVMEYIADPTLCEDGHKIHKFCEDALICYIQYHDIRNKRIASSGEKQLARKEYYNARRLAKLRMGTIRKSEALDAIARQTRLVPKG